MYNTNFTDDFNDTLSINNNGTNNDKNFEIIIPLFTMIPCSVSFLRLISFLVYTLVKPLFSKN